MAPVQRFRSALNGFNREDVVHYIEYLNNFYTSQIQQLNTQLQNAAANSGEDKLQELQAQLDAALEKCSAFFNREIDKLNSGGYKNV